MNLPKNQKTEDSTEEIWAAEKKVGHGSYGDFNKAPWSIADPS
jgi:hypothetical protein